jgi:hypothetical protein
MATTTNALSMVEVNSRAVSIGKTIDAVVTIATVEDPCAVFIKAAMRKGSAIPKGKVFSRGSTLRWTPEA